MQLLIERSQATSVATLTEQTNFKLWAMFELTPDEQGLIDNYTLRETILVEERKGQWRKAAIWGAISAFLVSFILDRLLLTGRENPLAILFAGFIIFLGLTWLIYQLIRKTIKMNDLLDGYTFTCKSVIELLQKERKVTELALAFRHLLESLKNWRKREIVKLEPYAAPTLPLIEKSHEPI